MSNRDAYFCLFVFCLVVNILLMLLKLRFSVLRCSLIKWWLYCIVKKKNLVLHRCLLGHFPSAVVACHLIFGMFAGGCTQRMLSLSRFGSLAHFILVCYKQTVETLCNLSCLGYLSFLYFLLKNYFNWKWLLG